ncbi:hypothetical protein [Gemmiger sp. An194]|uniref:hypothetical protein n=1 Tax=Gemmiger sp. An194 TaxID=1965582 RepID=UPI000B3ACDFC|nr:hypothetical protein [Gemmiger sp. An194]OUP23978.1 hypothetical protein B5F28_08890 [Gemmiger sp. An194]
MKLLFPILAGLGVVLLYLVWAALLHDFLNGLSPEGALTVATGSFLAFELVILASWIRSKTNRK